MGKTILADPKLEAKDVQCAVVNTGKNHLEHLLSDIDDDLEDAREDLADAEGGRLERLQKKIQELEKKRKEIEPLGFLARIEPVFVVPNEIYSRYQEDTDVQFLLSDALLDHLRGQIGDELVDRHVLKIKILPQDTDQFWRDPKPTAKGSAAKPPEGKLALHPLGDLASLFEAALSK